MSSNYDSWLPLEKKLEELAGNNKDEFPDQHVDYWSRYRSLLSSLRTYVYPHINAGLSCLSKSPGYYTDHGERHFDEVVRYAGLLLENTFDHADSSLRPYELYLLLCAIRVHDAGNIDGREDHDKRAYSILNQYGGDIRLDGPEHHLIGDIAKAHGGRTIDSDDKDTIGALLDRTIVGAISVRPQLVAAIVRFADEVCEHRSRATHHHIKQGNLPVQSKIFQHYANCITGAKPDRNNKSFILLLSFDVALFGEKYQKDETGEEQQYLIDEVLCRIDKLNHERVYCNRFLLPQMQTDRLEISMEFTKTIQIAGTDHQNVVGRRAFPVRDKGYPSVPQDWKDEISDINGVNFAGKVW